MLIYTSPGIENDVFGFQIVNARVATERTFCYINTTVPDIAKKVIYSYGWEVEDAESAGKFFFIDACSMGISLPGKGKYSLAESSASEIDDVVIKSLEDISGGTGVINSFSGIVDSIGEEEALKLVKKWNDLAAKNGTNLVYLFTVWEYSKDFLDRIQEMMNSVVLVSGIEERVIIGQYFAVIKADWANPKGVSILFKIARPGGVRVFIPKLLITGPFNSGKSSFMHSLATKSVSVDRSALERIPTTVALDIGHVEYKSFNADLFGTPGQERFDMLLGPLGREAVGAFILVDSTNPDTFERAKDMIKKCDVEGLPKVVVANKQDAEGALSIDEIGKRMGLGKTPVIAVKSAPGTTFPLKAEPCPLDKEDVLKALDALLDQIYR
jgi:hypothetical protein